MFLRKFLDFTISQKSQAILLLLGILVYSSSSNMGCEMCDICEIFPKVRGSIELQLTDNLTDPNSISQISQPEVIISPDLLWMDNI